MSRADGVGKKKADRDYMRMIPGRVAKVDEGDNGDEQVNREFEHFEIWTTHGSCSKTGASKEY
jgi:hypothetical protein